jgi:type II secretory pathway pseudopilin PulG
MKFATRTTSRARLQSAFTLAEVLAALLFMAIVIPVAVEGMQIASRAGSVAERKSQAVRVAERILNENLVTTNFNKASQNGTLEDGDRQYRWTLRTDAWPLDANQTAPRLLTVEVTYAVQNRDYSVRLSTLSNSQ